MPLLLCLRVHNQSMYVVLATAHIELQRTVEIFLEQQVVTAVRVKGRVIQVLRVLVQKTRQAAQLQGPPNGRTATLGRF